MQYACNLRSVAAAEAPRANFPNVRPKLPHFSADRAIAATSPNLSTCEAPVAAPAEPKVRELSGVWAGLGISGWNAIGKLALAVVYGLGVPASQVLHRRMRVNRDSTSQRHTLEKIFVRKSAVGHLKWSVRTVKDALANFKPRKP